MDVTPAKELLTDEGLNEPLVPDGSPLTLRFTVVGLFTALIVTVYVPCEPRLIVCDVGDTLMVKSAVTLSVVDPEMDPEAALIVAVPAATAVARPDELIVATAVFDDDHVTDDVMFLEEPSE